MGGVLSACSVPSNARVTIKTAVQRGRAVGVTVTVRFERPKPAKRLSKAAAKAESKRSTAIGACVESSGARSRLAAQHSAGLVHHRVLSKLFLRAPARGCFAVVSGPGWSRSKVAIAGSSGGSGVIAVSESPRLCLPTVALRRRDRFWVAGAVVAVAAVSCRQLVGIQNDPPGALGEVCGLTYASNACGSCAATNCCAESSTCAASPFCAAYETCILGCSGAPACESACFVDSPLGSSAGKAAALSACLAARCGTACNVSCGGVGGLASPPDAAAACQACYAENACDAGAACNASPDCLAEVLCYASCSTTDCRQACATSIPDDAGLVSTVGGVRLGPCQTACDHGTDWGCLGHVTWPPTKASSSEVTLQIIDFADSFNPDPKGLPGVQVRYCSGDDFTQDADAPCSNPIAGPTLTDENGIAILTGVSTGEPAFLLGYVPNYIELSSTPASEAILTELVFFGFPLSEEKYSLVPANREPKNNGAFVTGPLPVLTPADLGFLPVSQSKEKGLIGAVVYDCLNAYALDVRLTLSGDNAGIDPFSVGEVGLDGIANVPPGRVTVTATPTHVGKASSQERVLVQANAVSVVFMVPTQMP